MNCIYKHVFARCLSFYIVCLRIRASFDHCPAVQWFEYHYSLAGQNLLSMIRSNFVNYQKTLIMIDTYHKNKIVNDRGGSQKLQVEDSGHFWLQNLQLFKSKRCRFYNENWPILQVIGRQQEKKLKVYQEPSLDNPTSQEFQMSVIVL